ncbi:hypothetical protein J6590_016897 [Homalodisca vitripennis]|nr:hypothetical protein J6590_016897 [Homalodisca vitripennis]
MADLRKVRKDNVIIQAVITKSCLGAMTDFLNLKKPPSCLSCDSTDRCEVLHIRLCVAHSNTLSDTSQVRLHKFFCYEWQHNTTLATAAVYPAAVDERYNSCPYFSDSLDGVWQPWVTGSCPGGACYFSGRCNVSIP